MVYNWFEIGPILWPGACLLCGAPGSRGRDLCTPCHAALPRNPTACVVCAVPLPAGAAPGTLCGQCQRRRPSFTAALVPYQYMFPIEFLVSELKFRHRLSAGLVLGDLLADAAARTSRPEILLPVPLHPQRLAERGFNQAAELALQVGRRLSVPVELGHLRRQRHTPAQRGLDRRARLSNLRGAFGWSGGAAPRHVALIDDVVTTGATAEAIARLLRRSGVKRVDVWAVARTPPSGA